MFWELGYGVNRIPSVPSELSLGRQHRSLQRLVTVVVGEPQETVGTKGGSFGRGGGFRRPWNSAEGNGESEKGSNIGPDVVTFMEGELSQDTA